MRILIVHSRYRSGSASGENQVVSDEARLLEEAGHDVAYWILFLLMLARALLVPSIWYEGAPRSILEAYSVGVPVLASRIGALPEVVEDNVSGLLVSPGNAGAWMGAIERMSDSTLVKRLREGASSLYESLYTPEQGLAHLERVYAEAISGRN